MDSSSLDTSDIEVKVKRSHRKSKKAHRDTDNEETEQTSVCHEVYQDPETSTIRKATKEVSSREQEYKSIKWKIISSFVALTIAASVSLVVSLYAAISGLPVSIVNQLETVAMAETSKLSNTLNTLELEIETLVQLNETLSNALSSIGKDTRHAIRSCSQLPPFSPSGHYHILKPDGSTIVQYCTTSAPCSGDKTAWAKLAEFDLRNTSHQCPSGLREDTRRGIRVCLRAANSRCASTYYNMAGIEYLRVCGKIIGYQLGPTGAFQHVPSAPTHHYDGIRISHGGSRSHIWTFAAAGTDFYAPSTYKCSCVSNATTNIPPPFVGEDYFCDSGNRNPIEPIILLANIYPDDPLWDGQGCGSSSPCCTFNNPPWFFKQLRRHTSDFIQMRVCLSAGSNIEDVGIQSVELYVQ